MKELDFHGYKVEEAIHVLNSLIIRHQESPEIQYRLIVGHGQIKREFLKMIKNYNLEGDVELGNTGAIIVNLGLYQ
jgi:DNA-nicking Smr family endonuclease